MTSEKKEIVSAKMVALQDEKERLSRELEDVRAAPVEPRSETVERLLELARDFAALWKQATVDEKRECFSAVVDRVAIHPAREKARLCLSGNFLRVKELQHTRDGTLCLSDGRGDWRNFEPSRATEPYLSAFLPSSDPMVLRALISLRSMGPRPLHGK